jgi:hypothetical protein
MQYFNLGGGNSIRFATGTSAPSVDPDAQAFITAAAITDPTQQSAVNNLVIGLKADGVWSKMKAIYPFVGGTASTHKFNLKNPLDTDAAFRLVFNGGITHSANGIKANGTNGYSDTKLIPSSHLLNNNTHLSYYSRENITANAVDIGNFTNGAFSLYNFAGTYFSDQYNNSTGRISSVNADTRGFITGSRTASNVHKLFRNGSQIGATNTGASGGLTTINNPMLISAANLNGSITYFSPRQYSFASIGDGLTDTEATNLNTRVTTFQTALNRNV